MGKVTLSVELCEGILRENRRIALYRHVKWPSIPLQGATIAFGKDNAGDNTGMSASVRRVFFNADGNVSVEVFANNLREEFDDIVKSAREDGFVEWAVFDR